MIALIATGITIVAMLMTFFFTAQAVSSVAKAKRTGRGKYNHASYLNAGTCVVFDDLNQLCKPE